MKYAWTGSRAGNRVGITGRFSRTQELLIATDVIRTVADGDEVATGGCSGVDELVTLTALALRDSGMRLKVVIWPADGEKAWPETRMPIDLLLMADEIHWRENGWKYLERDRALVEWADQVHAIPMYPFMLKRDNTIVAERGGTNYTARYAQLAGKLMAEIALVGGVPGGRLNLFIRKEHG